MTDVVTERNFDRVFPPEKREKYWERVERALDEVFGATAGAAKRYREAVAKAPMPCIRCWARATSWPFAANGLRRPPA